MSRRYAFGSSYQSIFHPSQLTGGQLYLRRDQATVSSWISDIGTARDFVQATGTKQPTIGANSVIYDGVDDFQKVTEANAFAADTSGVIFFSYYWDGANNRYIISSSDEATTNNAFSLFCNTSGKIRLVTIISGVLANIEISGISVVGYNYGYVRSSGSLTYGSLNGVAETVGTAISGTDLGIWFSNIPDRDNIVLGALIRSVFNSFESNLNKIYYNNTALTTTEINNMNTFMSDPTNY